MGLFYSSSDVELVPKSADITSEPVIPNSNIQNQWDVSDVSRIVEAGDGLKNSIYGYDRDETDIFSMNDLAEEHLITITSVTIHVLCRCGISSMGHARLNVNFEFSTSSWSSSKTVQAPFGEAWKSFTWSSLNIEYKSGRDSFQIKLDADIYATGYGGWISVDAVYAEISYEYKSEKIGVFFWAGDAGTTAGNIAYEDEIDAHINSYKNILVEEGYTEFFPFDDIDKDDLSECFSNVSEYEIASDIVFFYIWGHGNTDDEDSFVKLNKYTDTRRCDLYSNNFIYRLSLFESTRIGYLVESCKSGYFVEDLSGEPYLAISSSDCLHDSRLDIYHEGRFSNHFWNGIENGMDAFDACVDANMWNQFYANPIWLIICAPLWWPLQYPLYYNNLYNQTGYMFFAN